MKLLVFLVLVGTLAACSGSPPMSPHPAGKATCALCAFLGDDRYTAADQLMAFAFAEEVEDLVCTVGMAIYPVVLPEAVGGEGEVTYRVSDLPEGLLFDAAARTISGTPEDATDGAVKVSYLAEDSAGTSATLTFCITVNPCLCDDWSFLFLFD